MKKLFKIILIATIFSSATFSYAISGACSSHGGANCSIGPNINGNVICNDGWANSSVPYISMNECYLPNSCPTYWTQSDYHDLVNKYNGIINSANQRIQSVNQESKNTCISKNTENYKTAQSYYQNCMNYQAGLHSLYLNTGGIDRSVAGACGEAPSLSSDECDNSTNPIDDQYNLMILEAKHEISCLKVLPTPKTDSEIKASIQKIADNIKNMSPEESKRLNDETCKTDLEYAKNDPIGFAEYKKGLEKLGIPLTNCNTTNTTTKKVSAPKPNSLINDLIKNPTTSTINNEVVPSAPTPKITFWHRVNNFFTKLKFWKM